MIWGYDPGFSGCIQRNRKGPDKGRQESLNQKNGRSHRERFEDVIPLTLNMEEETTSQRMQVASRS